MFGKLQMAAAVLAAGFILAGCATNCSELRVPSSLMPSAAAKAQAPLNGKTVVIRTVEDARVFDKKVELLDPTRPSLGFEGAENASADVKARAIGRKRNGFGAYIGDVLLQKGKTVSGLVRDNLAAAFKQAGYTVAANEAGAGPSPILVDVRIVKLWEWFVPEGIWTVTMGANMETDLTVAGAPPVNVAVKATIKPMAATDGEWLKLLDEVVTAYRAEVATRLNKPPF